MRKISAVVLGVIGGTLLFFMIGMVANWVNPTPPELMDPATPEAVAQRVASTTTYTWLTTIFGLAVGSFFAGVLGAFIAKKNTITTTTLIGTIFSLWSFYTFYIVYPEVLWVPVVMLLSAFYFSFLGGKIMNKSKGV